MSRWVEVNRASVVELRSLTPAAKLRQLESLMASAGLFEQPCFVDPQDERVRQVWNRLHALNGS